jgi:hypothetical protein
MSTSVPTAAESIDPDVEDAIACAKQYRGMLEDLAQAGAALAKDIVARAIGAPDVHEPRHEPAQAFAKATRAVRLTLAFATRITADIIAMRRGELPSAFRSSARPAPVAPSAPEAPVYVAPVKPVIDPRRVKVRAAVWGVINHEINNYTEATELLDLVHESLIEREDYEDLLDGRWRECVATVCADTGLHPDWSLWSDETGFPMHDVGPHKDWPRVWSYSRANADERRRSKAERLKAAEAATPARPPERPPPRW